MCLTVDPSVKSLNKRIVWKIFDKPNGKIVSLYQAAEYPLNKRIERNRVEEPSNGILSYGIHVYLTKRAAAANAKFWNDAHIARFSVDPKDFLAADTDGETAAYHAATRTGKFIRVAKFRK